MKKGKEEELIQIQKSPPKLKLQISEQNIKVSKKSTINL